MKCATNTPHFFLKKILFHRSGEILKANAQARHHDRIGRHVGVDLERHAEKVLQMA
jgi:hypothetical protein